MQAQAVDQLGAGVLDRAEAAAAKGDGDDAVREGVAGAVRGSASGVAGRGPGWIWNWRLPVAGRLRLEEDAGDVLVGAGLDLLEGNGGAGLVADPAVVPVVEVEVGLGLDEGAARLGVGVEDDDLVFVDLGERAVGPAAGEVEEHLLAGDTGAALHGADAVPGGGDRGAGQDVVELGEEEVVPGGVEAGEGGVALGGVGGEGGGGGFGLGQELLAVALGGLDVVHHAVAAGEAVLQLGR